MHTTIDARTHGILDYVTVAVFALAPIVLGMTGLAATISYALAAVHLGMTLATAFPMGVGALVPFPLHGKVELGVGIALVVIGIFDVVPAPGWVFFLAMGTLILAIWALTDYATPVSARV